MSDERALTKNERKLMFHPVMMVMKELCADMGIMADVTQIEQMVSNVLSSDHALSETTGFDMLLFVTELVQILQPGSRMTPEAQTRFRSMIQDCINLIDETLMEYVVGRQVGKMCKKYLDRIYLNGFSIPPVLRTLTIREQMAVLDQSRDLYMEIFSADSSSQRGCVMKDAIHLLMSSPHSLTLDTSANPGDPVSYELLKTYLSRPGVMEQWQHRINDCLKV